MPQLEHIEAIEKRLWTAADTLHANSNYASNEYFLPVMGLVWFSPDMTDTSLRVDNPLLRSELWLEGNIHQSTNKKQYC